MSKIALLLFGISYLDNYQHWHPNKLIYNIDWKYSFENYQNFIIQYFQKKGYQVDIFLVSNKIDALEQKKLLEAYKPIKYDFIENKENIWSSRNRKVDRVIDLCLESNINYKMVCITRFDLQFQKNFNTCLIDENTINIVSQLEKPELLCDNFYIIPYKYIHLFSKLVKSKLDDNFHKIKKNIEKISPINYLCNENVKVSSLSFYKIVRNKTNNNIQETTYYCYKKHFSKKDDIITCVQDTFIKIKILHSDELKETEKIFVNKGAFFQLTSEVKDYYIIKI